MAQTQTMQMAPYYGGDFRRVPWSPQLRDNIGSAVRTARWAGGQAAPAPTPYTMPPAVVPAAAGPAPVGPTPGTAPNGAYQQGATTQEDLIAETMGLI